MTIDDAINIARVLGNERAHDEDRDITKLATAAKRLVCHVEEQRVELERERARRKGLRSEDTRLPEGHQIKNGSDAGGARDFLAGRSVHAGELLYVLTYAGWHPVRYESNMPLYRPVLYLPLPGVRADVVLGIPQEACFAWPEELRHGRE
jgi:hypothetical protein